MSEVAKRIAYKTAVRNFLDAFCIPDRRGITETVHKQMMLAHFYYVDDNEQGYYILDDPDQFHRELTDSEYYVYGTMWGEAVAQE